MQKLRITKTLSLDQAVARSVEKLARQERRSFTQQVEILLAQALARQNNELPTEAQG